LIENMAVHICSQCGHEDPVFGIEGAAKAAAEYQVAVLAQLPLARAIREDGDVGRPAVLARPDSRESKMYEQAAVSLLGSLETRAAPSAPVVQFSDD
jgi:ATP-binding protein involved in chromosome partitioning